jgi:hypothetical protein
MTGPRISAIAIGFFLGFVAPYAVFVLVAYAIPLSSTDTSGVLPAWLNLLGLAIAFGAPVGAGYLAARVAQVQPLLHGCVVGLLGSIMFGFIGSPMSAALFAAFVFVPGGIAGGWLWKARGGKGAP